MPVNYIPDGFRTVTPYLIVPGASRLLEFVKAVFDAEPDVCMQRPDGGIAHASVKVGDSIIELGDSGEKWPPMPAALHVYVPDVEATYRRAIEAGATSLYEPSDMFYGERSGGVKDPVGNQWFFATVTEELSMEEVNRRAAQLNEQQGG